MTLYDVAANTLRGAGPAADTPTPTPTDPAPEPTVRERARATACEYTGLGCDVVEDASQTATGRTRQTTEAGWFGRTEDGGGAVVEQTLDDGSSMRGLHARAEPGDRAFSAFRTITRLGDHVSLETDFMTAEDRRGVHSDGTNTRAGFSRSASAIDLVAHVEGENFRAHAGLSAGAGATVEIAREDADNDGVPEVCIDGAYAFGTGGGCVEVPRSIAPAVDKVFDVAAELSPQRLIYRFSR